MTNDAGSDSVPHHVKDDALIRVRQLDPTIEEASVRVYMREIADADALLNTLDPDDAPLSVSFSAHWPQGGGQ